ncbi:6036_t:CDS:2, partial [Gigaspora margarita]
KLSTSARNYIPESISEEIKTSNTNTPKSELEQKLDFYKKKVAVYNTEMATQNWVKKFEEFHGNESKATTIKQAVD